MSTISFTEPQLREAIASSRSLSDAIRKLGLRPAGGNHATIKKYVQLWDISVDHLGPRGPYPRGGVAPRPLEQVLVKGSTYHRGDLKSRLYASGLKRAVCELCGQGEQWRGRRMAMILDHINGDATDNRLENLRIVCPNCNATLETHCGRNKSRGRPPHRCEHCGGAFRASRGDQRFCSQLCAAQHNGPATRRATRPPLDELAQLVAREGYEAVGRRYGVSGNAVRKWFRFYGQEPPAGPGHLLHPPPLPRAALSDGQATRALDLLAAGSSMYAVAKALGVSKTVIRGLRRGRTYRHLERPAALREAA